MKATFFTAALLLAVPIVAAGTAHAKPLATVHYDCTKAGNKTKAACKAQTSSSVSSSAVSSKLATAQPSKSKTFDCTKSGNKNKAQCKVTTVAAATPQTQLVTAKPTGATTPAAPTPAANLAKTAATTAPSASASKPAGATAQCKDGSYSMSKQHSGSCSHHGGVKQFYS